MMANIESLREEVEKIRSADPEGKIRPKAIVAYARRNKASALYERFTWDDTEAGEKWRLEEARHIIRMVAVTVIKTEHAPQVVSVSQYVSLSDNRDNGYEHIEEVMSDKKRSAVLLVDVIKRLLGIKEVGLFKELASVNRAIQKVAAEYVPEEEGEKRVSVRVGREMAARL